MEDHPGTDLDGFVVEVQRVLPAEPPVVFALLTDVERVAGLGPEHVSAHWEGPRRGMGARFSGVNANGAMTWRVPCEVVVWDPPNAFGWVVGKLFEPTAIWSYALTAAPGGTQVVQTFRHGPGFSYVRRALDKRPEAAEQIIRDRGETLRTNMLLVLDAVAGLLTAV